MSRELSSKENKIYKTLEQKLNLTEIEDAKEFSLIKQGKRFIIDKPKVYKIENSSSLLVFGDFRLGFDINKLKEEIMKRKEDLENKVDEKVESVAEEPLSFDADKINEEDINVIMSQGGLSREKAIRALVNADYDVIKAMLDLSQ